MEERPKRSYSWKIVGGFLIFGILVGQFIPNIVPAFAKNDQIDFNELQSAYDILQRKYDGNLDKEKILESAKAGMISGAGDPYTTYLNAKSAKELNDQLSGTLSGVGAEVAIKNNKLVVVTPVDGSPAEKAGLKPGDWITKIDDADSSTLTLDEAVSKIRGEKGTKVNLTIVRAGSQSQVIGITREVISVPSVKWSMKNGDIGYIEITQFGTDTSEKIKQAAADLKSQGAKKIVLDLRNNSGGYLDAAVKVSNEFLPSGQVVVEERQKGKTVEKLETEGGGQLVGLPMVVLINEGSASASEIVAGALKDNKAAILIGEKSFGKGSVQEVIKLGGGAELKVTIARWYTPSGKGIDKEGIKPDVEIKQSTEDFNADRDPQLERAIQELQSR